MYNCNTCYQPPSFLPPAFLACPWNQPQQHYRFKFRSIKQFYLLLYCCRSIWIDIWSIHNIQQLLQHPLVEIQTLCHGRQYHDLHACHQYIIRSPPHRQLYICILYRLAIQPCPWVCCVLAGLPNHCTLLDHQPGLRGDFSSANGERILEALANFSV